MNNKYLNIFTNINIPCINLYFISYFILFFFFGSLGDSVIMVNGLNTSTISSNFVSMGLKQSSNIRGLTGRLVSHSR